MGLPALAMAWQMYATNRDFINSVPSWKRKKGPKATPRKATNDIIATTGQSSSPVAPRKMATPRPSWSVFERFRKIRTLDRWWPKSTAMSPPCQLYRPVKGHGRRHCYLSRSNKIPHKHTNAVAHGTAKSCRGDTVLKFALICRRMGGVIGKRSLGGGPC